MQYSPPCTVRIHPVAFRPSDQTLSKPPTEICSTLFFALLIARLSLEAGFTPPNQLREISKSQEHLSQEKSKQKKKQ